jgi:dihydrofolate reductase
MRKIIVSEMISLDGFFENKNKEPDWHTVSEDFFEYSRELLNSVDVLLFGRITYQMMESFWPDAVNEDTVITHKMNHLDKIVFTKTLKKAEWNNSEIAKGNLKENVLKLKKQPGKDIAIFGSGSIVNELTALHLIDEYRLAINPVILGNGNPLFKSFHDKINLELLQTKTLDSGVVILYYKPTNK